MHSSRVQNKPQYLSLYYCWMVHIEYFICLVVGNMRHGENCVKFLSAWSNGSWHNLTAMFNIDPDFTVRSCTEQRKKCKKKFVKNVAAEYSSALFMQCRVSPQIVPVVFHFHLEFFDVF